MAVLVKPECTADTVHPMIIEIFDLREALEETMKAKKSELASFKENLDSEM